MIHRILSETALPVEPSDLLLLNASNLPATPIFPYAFVQVTALARRHGLRVARFDFVGLPKQRWLMLLAELIACHRPRMIGLHLRQADTVVASDYLPPPEGDPAKYFLPVDDTAELLHHIRALTEVPVVAGGFGFSAYPLRTAQRLGVDFGVQGEPDGFFERWDDVLAGRRLGEVPNLVFRQGRHFRANPRVFYPPSPEGEYDETLIAELVRFYGERPLLDGSLVHVPVEIARGCPFRCYFCNEPAVKGREVRYRPWAAVAQDLDLLERHGIRYLWFVCSEINIHPTQCRALARRMAARNRGREPARPTRWRSYNIPRMSAADTRRMIAAGFEPGCNDFPSFDDQNLTRCRVPFRSAAALAYYRRFLDWADAQPVAPRDRQIFYLFLGNAFADARTIATTLRSVDRHGLADRHEIASLGAATRVFEIDGALSCGDARSMTTVGRAGKARLDLVGPTYHYPPALVRHLGSEKAVREFLAYVGATFLSSEHERQRDWPGFLGRSLGPAALLARMREAKQAGGVKSLTLDAASDAQLGASILRILHELWRKPDASAVSRLLFRGGEREAMNYVAQAVAVQLLRPHARAFRRVLRFLRIPTDRGGFHCLTPYRVAEILYRRWDSTEDLLAETSEKCAIAPGSLDALTLHYLLFENNLRIRKEYRALLFPSP
jgi:hypothetical protein